MSAQPEPADTKAAVESPEDLRLRCHPVMLELSKAKACACVLARLREDPRSSIHIFEDHDDLGLDEGEVESWTESILHDALAEALRDATAALVKVAPALLAKETEPATAAAEASR